jgi:hypothetical protein
VVFPFFQFEFNSFVDIIVLYLNENLLMNEIVKTYSVKSMSLNLEFGKFYVRNNGQNHTVYSKSGDVMGRYDSEANALKIAENLAYKKIELIKLRLNSAPTTDMAQFDENLAFLEKQEGCMIGGFYIINGHRQSKGTYLMCDKETRFLYPNFKAAFADLITLHKVKDLEVFVS